MFLYKAQPQMTYDFLYNLDNTTFISCSENYAHFHYLFLKQGTRLEDLIKKGSLIFIDLFSQSKEEDFPYTENHPKTWMEQDYEWQENLIQFINDKAKLPRIIIQNLFYFDLLCKQRNLKTIDVIRSLLRFELHIYTPIVEEVQFLILFITKHATKVITLQPNQSGFSKDMDGQIFDGEKRQIYQLGTNDVKYLSALV